jgi:hypothetical protein
MWKCLLKSHSITSQFVKKNIKLYSEKYRQNIIYHKSPHTYRCDTDRESKNNANGKLLVVRTFITHCRLQISQNRKGLLQKFILRPSPGKVQLSFEVTEVTLCHWIIDRKHQAQKIDSQVLKLTIGVPDPECPFAMPQMDPKWLLVSGNPLDRLHISSI